jgi:OOP family OmpA-OmpF porin
MKKVVTNNDYNKWSIELAGGFNKPQRPMTSLVTYIDPSPYVIDLGARLLCNV